MDTNIPYLLPVSLEALEKEQGFPKYIPGYLWYYLKAVGRGFAKTFPSGLILSILLLVAYFLVHTYFFAFIHGGYRFTRRGTSENSITPYLLAGRIRSATYYGYQHYPARLETSTGNQVVPFTFLMGMLLAACIRRLVNGSAKRMPLQVYQAIRWMRGCDVLFGIKKRRILLLTSALCFGAGFVVKNPFTILLLSVLLFFSFAKMERGFLFSAALTYSCMQRKRKRCDTPIRAGHILYAILCMSMGFGMYFIVCIVLWYVFQYSLLSRALITTILFSGFMILYFASVSHKAVLTTAGGCISLLAAQLLFSSTAWAACEGGGWVDSGSNLFSWLANPGTRLLMFHGFESGTAGAFGWLADTIFNAPIPQAGGVPIASIGKIVIDMHRGAPGSAEANMGAGKAALDAALPGLGSVLGNAAQGIGDALSGSRSSSGTESGGSSGSSRPVTPYSGNSGSRTTNPVSSGSSRTENASEHVDGDKLKTE